MEMCGHIHAPTALPLGNNSRTHPTGDRVGPRVGLNALELIKYLAPARNRTPDRPSHYTDNAMYRTKVSESRIYFCRYYSKCSRPDVWKATYFCYRRSKNINY